MAPSLGRGDTYDVGMLVAIFRTFQAQAKSVDTAQLANRPFSLPHHEGEGESDNEHLCGALDPVMDQNANRGDVRVKKHALKVPLLLAPKASLCQSLPKPRVVLNKLKLRSIVI